MLQEFRIFLHVMFKTVFKCSGSFATAVYLSVTCEGHHFYLGGNVNIAH